MAYEYWAVPAPTQTKLRKGEKTAVERLAGGMTELINDFAMEGWEYLRAETLNVLDKPNRFTKPVERIETILIFRRVLDLDETAPRAATANAQNLATQNLNANIAAQAVTAPAEVEIDAVEIDVVEQIQTPSAEEFDRSNVQMNVYESDPELPRGEAPQNFVYESDPEPEPVAEPSMVEEIIADEDMTPTLEDTLQAEFDEAQAHQIEEIEEAPARQKKRKAKSKAQSKTQSKAQKKPKKQASVAEEEFVPRLGGATRD